jgi:hypothetical protein
MSSYPDIFLAKVTPSYESERNTVQGCLPRFNKSPKLRVDIVLCKQDARQHRIVNGPASCDSSVGAFPGRIQEFEIGRAVVLEKRPCRIQFPDVFDGTVPICCNEGVESKTNENLSQTGIRPA